MVYTWDKANADASTRHTTQYFEMFGTHAIYHDGWVAAAASPVPPWEFATKTAPPNPLQDFTWELYNLKDDWTENNDLAKKEPAKLQELEQLFVSEAQKYNVFPLNDSIAARLLAPRPDPSGGLKVLTYSGELANVPWSGAPNLLDQGYAITAEVEIPQGGAEGMLVTQGGRFGGYGFYLLKGRPVFTWDLLGVEMVRWEGPDALAPGKHTLAFEFKCDGGGLGKGGQDVLRIDGKEASSKRMARSVPSVFPWTDAFNVGVDTGTPVDVQDYAIPFRFTGTIRLPHSRSRERRRAASNSSGPHAADRRAPPDGPGSASTSATRLCSHSPARASWLIGAPPLPNGSLGSRPRPSAHARGGRAYES
jgi:hypothetical protein